MPRSPMLVTSLVTSYKAIVVLQCASRAPLALAKARIGPIIVLGESTKPT